MNEHGVDRVGVARKLRNQKLAEAGRPENRANAVRDPRYLAVAV